MKVIGTVPRPHTDPAYLVELTPDEIRVICGFDYNRMTKGLAIGSDVPVCDRFHHSQDVLREVKDAQKLPGQLRALADTLELAAPALKQIEDAKEDGVTVVDDAP